MPEQPNLDSHPYRVMFNETVPLQTGGELTRTREHCGVSTIESAQASVNALRDMASKCRGFGYKTVINSAWIEYTHRTRLEY